MIKNNNRNNKNIILAVVIVLIAAFIGYLEYSKNIGRVNVPKGSADIPLTLQAEDVDIASGQCTTEYCTTTTSTQPASVLNSENNKVAAISNTSLAEKMKKYPRAKELVSPDGFINSPAGAGAEGQNGSAPFKIADLIGKKIIVIDFWTYSCINCQRTLPYLNAWYKKYKDAGLEIIGIETPEFDFEKNKENVQSAVTKYGIKYPVVQDNHRGTWNAYQNLYWPRKYIIDIDGFIVYDHIGEGGYEETELKIQELLKEKASRDGGAANIAERLDGLVAAEIAKTAVVGQSGISPETYFGAARNDPYVGSWNPNMGTTGIQTYTKTSESEMFKNKFYLSGTWNIFGEYIENQTAADLTYKYTAMNVYLVAASKDGKPINVDVYQDGIKIKTVTVQGATLYPLVKNTGVEAHTLELRIPKAGLQAYTFTFG